LAASHISARTAECATSSAYSSWMTPNRRFDRGGRPESRWCVPSSSMDDSVSPRWWKASTSSSAGANPGYGSVVSRAPARHGSSHS
jgi:hypothetical protein